MNKKRLTILRAALIGHATNPGNLRFDLRDWATVHRKYEGATNAVREAALGHNYCGTTACAMGLAASIPSFQRDGLELYGCGSAFGIQLADPGAMFGVHYGFEAAAHFFAICKDDALELFSPEKYAPAERKNPLAVADKITALLECGER